MQRAYENAEIQREKQMRQQAQQLSNITHWSGGFLDSICVGNGDFFNQRSNWGKLRTKW